MAKLNNTILQIRVKRGTEAQINAASPVPYQLVGELALSTDTHKLFVSDGTSFTTPSLDIATHEGEVIVHEGEVVML